MKNVLKPGLSVRYRKPTCEKAGYVMVNFKPGIYGIAFASCNAGKKEAINSAMDRVIQWATEQKIK